MRNYINKIKDSIKIFNLDIHEWLPARDIIWGLIISSLLINILSLVFPLSLLQIYDRIIPNESTSTLIYLMSAVCVAMILEMFLKLARNYVSTWGDAKLGFKSATQAYHHLINSKLSEFEKIGSGVHLDRINALNRVKDFYGGQALTTVIDLPFVMVYLLIMALIHPLLMIVPIAIQAILVLLAVHKGPGLYETLKHRAQTNEKKLNYVVEVLSGIHTIKSQGMEHVMLRRYERLQKSSAIDDFEYAQSNSSYHTFGQHLSQLNLILVVCLGAILAVQGQITPGGVAACILLSSRCMIPFVKFVGLWSQLQNIKLAHQKYNAIRDLKQETGGFHLVKHIERGDIEIKNAGFEYENTENKIFNGISLQLPFGQSLHIDSDGSAGKTTLMHLIKGIIQPTQGQILIDGIPINQYDAKILGEKIAYVQQDSNFFQGTILDNLTLFENERFADKAKELAKLLDLDTAIEQMPHGYETKVGQGSADFLSKGIKQRIILIRSLVREPKILLFDEANSAMDIASDILLQKLLSQYKGKLTIIMITHRPSMAKICDRACIIQNEQLVEVGSHHE